MESHDLLGNDIQVNETAQSTLLDAARWGKFLAIMGFILCGLMVVAAFVTSSYISNVQQYSYNASAASAARTAIIIVYTIFAVIFFFPCLFLYRFSVRMQQAFKGSSQEYFESSLRSLRSMFRFVGILMIIFLVIWIFSLLTVAISAANNS